MAVKNKQEILDKLGIEQLNSMQEEAILKISTCSEVILLSPTGTGKTLAFLLPIIDSIDDDLQEVQALIVVPTRELAIQIEQVVREMGTGYKINAVYGGRSGSMDKLNLKHRPSVLIGTPGRVSDHIRRSNFATKHIQTIVLDEFDKSLEIGFKDEMEEILEALPSQVKKVLTSATKNIEIPSFVELKDPINIDYLDTQKPKIQIKYVDSPSKDKLQTLLDTLCHIGNNSSIVFCNFRDSIERVSDFLYDNNIGHVCFHGGMEQIDRETSLIKFRNGSSQILLTTDLAARGIDVPAIKYIIHYHLPGKETEFTHRNGRTARMHDNGTVYVIKWENDELPEYMENIGSESLSISCTPEASEWQTIIISGGRRDNISKADIAGFFFRLGELKKDELGLIELKQDCSFAAVKSSRIKHVLKTLDNGRLKKKKVRLKLA